MISTHILDTTSGQPAQNVLVELAVFENTEWRLIQSAQTNSDGRISFTCDAKEGTYRLKFKVEEYFQKQQLKPFFVVVPVVFNITDTNRKYHVPLLLNPFGYSTYRGS